MPIYEYACGCGARFEELVLRRSDEEAVRCPTCGAAEVAREMSRPAAAPAAGGGRPSSSGRSCGPIG